MIRERTERSQIIMAKWSKKLLGLAAIGSAAAGLVYYLKKSKKNEDDDFNDDFEDEDFDLDNDLQPVDRGYVDLNAAKTTTEEDNAADDSTEDTSEDADAKDTPDTPKTLTKTTGMTRITAEDISVSNSLFAYTSIKEQYMISTG